MAHFQEEPKCLVQKAEFISDQKKAISEYFKLKQEDHIIEKYKEWDVARTSPVAELIKARRELTDAENHLIEKRREQKSMRIYMDQQWSELRNNEESLRQSFIKFNKLIKENREKRIRAENKMKKERELQEKRKEETEDLEKSLEKLKTVRDKIKTYVDQYKIYQNYLERVVKETNEFQSIPEIFNRYETLVEAKAALSEEQDHSLVVLEEASTDMHKMTESKSKMLMNLSNELAQLQGRYDRTKALCIKWETIVARIKAAAAEKSLELTQIRYSCWNIYLQICKRKRIPIEVDRNDVEQQLVQIKRTILELKRITKAAKKRAIKASREEKDGTLYSQMKE